jgi:predicted molibdopterin-dependent oxidoreductase YjgC
MAAEELADNEYPLFLTTGSLIYHWHGEEITSRVKGLPEHKVCAVKVELA